MKIYNIFDIFDEYDTPFKTLKINSLKIRLEIKFCCISIQVVVFIKSSHILCFKTQIKNCPFEYEDVCGDLTRWETNTTLGNWKMLSCFNTCHE